MAATVSVRRRAGGTATGLWLAVIAAPSAHASGREGAAVAEAVVWLIVVTAAALAVFLVGGVLFGLYRAGRERKSIPRVFVEGLAHGGLAFLMTVGGLIALGSAIMMAFGAWVIVTNWDEIFR